MSTRMVTTSSESSSSLSAGDSTSTTDSSSTTTKMLIKTSTTNNEKEDEFNQVVDVQIEASSSEKEKIDNTNDNIIQSNNILLINVDTSSKPVSHHHHHQSSNELKILVYNNQNASRSSYNEIECGKDTRLELEQSTANNDNSNSFNDFEYWKRSLSSDLVVDQQLLFDNQNDLSRIDTPSLCSDSYYSKKFSENTSLQGLVDTPTPSHKRPTNLLSTPAAQSQSGGLITTTRFLHPATPTTPHHHNQLVSSSSSSIPQATPVVVEPSLVSKLSSWLKRPNQLLSRQSSNSDTPSGGLSSQLNAPLTTMSSLDKNQSFVANMLNKQTNNTSNMSMMNTSSSTDLGYNLPLSIDFLRKLKRPTNVPSHLEYTNGQVFQGSQLEDWLMQSLEEHINTFCSNQKGNVNKSSIGFSSQRNSYLPPARPQQQQEIVGVTTTATATEEQTLSVPGLITTPSTATNSATSLVIEITNSNPNGVTSDNQHHHYQHHHEFIDPSVILPVSESVDSNRDQINSSSVMLRRLNSDSYKAAMCNFYETSGGPPPDLAAATPIHESSSTSVTSGSLSSSALKSGSNEQQNQQQQQQQQYQNNLIYKRQEANYYVQQILTNLLAIGVLEYESGFENAINKTFKPKSDYVWGRYFPIDMNPAGCRNSSSATTTTTAIAGGLHVGAASASAAQSAHTDLSRLPMWPPPATTTADINLTDETKISCLDKSMADFDTINSLRKEHKELIDSIKKQHDFELINLKEEHSSKLAELEERVDKLSKENELNKKCVVELSAELEELKKSKADSAAQVVAVAAAAPPPPPPPLPPLFLSSSHSSCSIQSISPTPGSIPIPPPPPPPPNLFSSSSSSLSGPPAPIPPPPPPPPFMSGFGGIPPPPPPPPMPNGVPLPPPPPLLMNGPPPPPFFKQEPIERPITRKKIQTKEEMKPLYWNRIQIFSKSDAIWFDVAEQDIGDEFEALFSKVALKSKQTNQKSSSKSGNGSGSSGTANKQECVKVLDAKRSQSIGILMSSKRLDSNVIRDALMSFDNQLLSYEILSSIYVIRPQEEELRAIQDVMKATANFHDEMLDKPELFLLELSRIPAFEERIYCLVYQNRFNESIASIEFRLSSMNTICDELMSNESIKKILGIILTCGNTMNSANKARGDADGFDLSILPNLKDVKSKDNSTNLIQYIAGFYVSQVDDNDKLPLPDPSDFNFVAQVNFDELDKELRRVANELKDIEERVEVVLKACSGVNEASSGSGSSSPSPLESQNELFKSRVSEFLRRARDESKEQEEAFNKCKTKFKKLITIYCIKPKPSDNEVGPEYFFSLWGSFCLDFKDAWKREKQKLAKLRLKQVNEKRSQIKSKITETKPVEKKSIKAIFQQKRNEESKKKS